MKRNIKKFREKTNKEKKWIIWIVLLIFFAFFLFLNLSNLGLLWDENVYLGNARSHITQSNFTEDFRFPLLEWIIALAWVFTGENVFIARMVIILMTLATVFLVYVIGKKYFSWQLSLLLCSLFALSPLLLVWGLHVYADIPAMFFVTLAFYFIMKSEEKQNKKSCLVFVALAGVFSALAFLTRFPLFLFAISLSIYLIIKKRIKHLLIFALAFLIALSPWLIYNQVNYNNPIWDLRALYSVVQTYTSPEPIMKQVWNLFFFTNFLVPVFLIIGLYASLYSLARKNRKDERLNLLILIYVLLSLVYYLFFVKLKDERYYFAFLPFVYLIAFRGFTSLFGWFNKKKINFRKIIFMIVIGLIVLSLFFNLLIAYALLKEKYVCGKNSSISQAIDYLKNDADYRLNENDTILSNAWPWFGYSLNVKAFTFWSDNIIALVDQYKAPYVIYSDSIGTKFDKEILDKSNILKLEKEFFDKCGRRIYLYSTNYLMPSTQ